MKGELMEKEEQILKEFVEKISKQEDLKPEYIEFINEHFWELI
jgi:hypothetical protein